MNGRARKRVLMRRSTVVFLAALMFAMMLPASAAAFIVVDEIHGNVKDAESEAALPGITVQHLKYNEPPGDYLPMGTDTTDANGYYGFATVTGPLGHRLIFSAASTRYRTAKYTFDYPGFPVTVNHSMRRVAERVAGQSRYSTAVAVARKGYDPDGDKSWPGVDHVVIASGEDRAAADPLAAAGLCWAYDAPLFLVSSKSVSQEVKQAVNEIVTANGPTVVHVVGGPVSVPDPRYTELESAVLGTLHKDRVLATGGRYDLAAAIAQRVKSVAQSNPAKDMPPAVLIANGADSTKFFDALALSAISAGKGCPILLVSADSIPSATRSQLENLGIPRAIVGGGPNTVSDGVYGQIASIFGTQIQRWYGQSRYSTAINIAEKAVLQEHWADFNHIGVAAKLPDALAGGSAVGKLRGVLVLTRGDSLTAETKAFLERWDTQNNHEYGACYVLGGKLSVTPGVQTKMIDALALP